MKYSLVLILLLFAGVPRRVTLAVTDMTPAADDVLTSAPTEILVTLNSAPDALSVNSTSVVVTRAGTDGDLDTGDDVTIVPASVTVVSGTVIRIDLAGAVLPDDLYQVRVRGAEIPIPGLVSHWMLDEGTGTSAVDSSGGGNTGTISGASWTTGRIGSGLSFNGVSDRVTISASNVPAPWTAAMWVYRLDSLSLDARVTDNLLAGGTSLRLEQYNNTNQCGYTQGGVADYVLPYTAPVGTWTHLAWVGQASGVALFANGVNVASNATPINLSRGTLGSAGGNSLLGSLDDVRFYDRPLSGPEILALARLGGAVRDMSGALLDGEFSGTYASGDGLAGGDFLASFSINTLAPVAPSALTAQPGPGTTILLAWADNATTETGFKIERGTDGLAFTQIDTAAADATSYGDASASGSAPYFYRVRATNAAGDSGYSNLASATPRVVDRSSRKKCGSIGVDLMLPLGLLWLYRRRRRSGRQLRR